MTYTHRYKTPDGFDDILMNSDGEVLTGLWFEKSSDEKKHDLHGMYNGTEKACSVFRETCRWLDIYFSGQNPDFTPPYRIENLTAFRSEVIKEMLTIPFGNTVTYGEIASKIAKRHDIKKMSSRAVGGAVGWNPICIIIPCHRVIGTNGKLTGYGGGVKNKIALLKLENINMEVKR